MSLSFIDRFAIARWAPIPLRLIIGYGFMERGFAKLAKGPDAFAHILQVQKGLKLGLQGVPFFVVNGLPALSGAQMPQTFLEVFLQASGKDAPQCGLESCKIV